jgi:hypothetical protein
MEQGRYVWRCNAAVAHSKWWQAVFRVALSLLGAGVFYVAWLAAFLLTVPLDSPIVQTTLWLLAPVLSAAGFSAGILIAERLFKSARSRPLRLFIWPLIGCALGAAAVFSFGPMLIVFGMFGAGTASIILREVVRIRR